MEGVEVSSSTMDVPSSKAKNSLGVAPAGQTGKKKKTQPIPPRKVEPLEVSTKKMSQKNAANSNENAQIGLQESPPRDSSTRTLRSRLSVIKHFRRKSNANSVTPNNDESESKSLVNSANGRTIRRRGRSKSTVRSTRSSTSRRSQGRSRSRVPKGKSLIGDDTSEDGSKTVEKRKSKKVQFSDNPCDPCLLLYPVIEAFAECTYFCRILFRCAIDQETEQRERRYRKMCTV